MATSYPSEEKKENRRLMLAMGGVVFAVAVLAIIGFLFINKPAEILQGQAEATSVRVSGKLPGRILEFYVTEGQMVHKGDTLVHIHSSLAEAKMEQARSMEDAASALNKKVDSGTRPQIVQSALEVWKQAQAAEEIAAKTNKRMEALYADGVISAQKRDEAQAAYQAATAASAAARSQYELAKIGPQSEDRTQSAAMVGVARGGVAEVQAVLEDQYLTAPCDGQIDVIFPHVGELVSLGAPIMNVLRIDDKWVTFNVREDQLKNFTMDKVFKVYIPALDKEAKVKIYYVRDMGAYATWHATKTTGDWDSKTFEVKARPEEQLPDLRPGMTVIYKE
jgi:secretion protein hlyD family protein